jgi:hypothetical protein
VIGCRNLFIFSFQSFFMTKLRGKVNNSTWLFVPNSHGGFDEHFGSVQRKYAVPGKSGFSYVFEVNGTRLIEPKALHGRVSEVTDDLE